jgi:hypothetical protein
MSYRAPRGDLNYARMGLTKAISLIPVVGQFASLLIPGDAFVDWTAINQQRMNAIAAAYRTRISPRASRLRMRSAARKRFLGIR